MPNINLQEFWEDHSVVTNEMVDSLKKRCGLQPYEGLMIVKNSNHMKTFHTNIPENMVAWLIVDRRLGNMTGYYLHDDNILYTDPFGNTCVRKKDM